MAIQRFKVALNNALFPLVSTKAQRAARLRMVSVSTSRDVEAGE